MAVFAAIFFHTFGTQLHDRGQQRRHADQPRAGTATYFSLISASIGNTILRSCLFGGYILFWPLICYISFIQPTRMLFAYAFDGILPKSVTSVTTKSGSPYVAVHHHVRDVSVLRWSGRCTDRASSRCSCTRPLSS